MHPLTAHQAEVHAVVERAEKDIAIESLLNTFEEVWLSRQLELKIHIRAGRHEVGLNLCLNFFTSLTAPGGLVGISPRTGG